MCLWIAVWSSSSILLENIWQAKNRQHIVTIFIEKKTQTISFHNYLIKSHRCLQWIKFKTSSPTRTQEVESLSCEYLPAGNFLEILRLNFVWVDFIYIKLFGRLCVGRAIVSGRFYCLFIKWNFKKNVFLVLLHGITKFKWAILRSLVY